MIRVGTRDDRVGRDADRFGAAIYRVNEGQLLVRTLDQQAADSGRDEDPAIEATGSGQAVAIFAD